MPPSSRLSPCKRFVSRQRRGSALRSPRPAEHGRPQDQPPVVCRRPHPQALPHHQHDGCLEQWNFNPTPASPTRWRRVLFGGWCMWRHRRDAPGCRPRCCGSEPQPARPNLSTPCEGLLHHHPMKSHPAKPHAVGHGDPPFRFPTQPTDLFLNTRRERVDVALLTPLTRLRSRSIKGDTDQPPTRRGCFWLGRETRDFPTGLRCLHIVAGTLGASSADDVALVPFFGVGQPDAPQGAGSWAEALGDCAPRCAAGGEPLRFRQWRLFPPFQQFSVFSSGAFSTSRHPSNQ